MSNAKFYIENLLKRLQSIQSFDVKFTIKLRSGHNLGISRHCPATWCEIVRVKYSRRHHQRNQWAVVGTCVQELVATVTHQNHVFLHVGVLVHVVLLGDGADLLDTHCELGFRAVGICGEAWNGFEHGGHEGRADHEVCPAVHR